MAVTDPEHHRGKMKNFMISSWLSLNHIFIPREGNTLINLVLVPPNNVDFTGGSGFLERNRNIVTIG